MVKTQKYKIILIGLMSIMTLFVAVLATYTWYVNDTRVDTSDSIVMSAETATLFAGFPESEANTDKYSGQTGIKWQDDDSPYILTYTPVILRAENLEDGKNHLMAMINGVRVKLTGTDAHGNAIVEEYLGITEEGRQMISNFTVRLLMKSYSYETMVDGQLQTISVTEEQSYVVENGYVVSEISRAPIVLVDSYLYVFDLQVVFLSEKGYTLLQSTQADIDPEYIFPLSDSKYMFSKIQLSFGFNLNGLLTVNFDANGGNCDTPYVETTGKGTVALPVPTRTNYDFAGWFYDVDCTVPFVRTSLTTQPISKDITIYAGWTTQPIVTFNARNGAANTTVHVANGGKVSAPTPPTYSGKTFVGWATDAEATYANYSQYAYDFNSVVNSNITLYGVWRNTYTVTLNLYRSLARYGELSVYQNGTLTNTISGNNQRTFSFSILEGQTVGSYFDANNTNYYVIEAGGNTYHFLKWSTEDETLASNADEYDMNTAITGNVSLYAYFQTG